MKIPPFVGPALAAIGGTALASTLAPSALPPPTSPSSQPVVQNLEPSSTRPNPVAISPAATPTPTVAAAASEAVEKIWGVVDSEKVDFVLPDVGHYMQNDPLWNDQPYSFGGAKGTLGHIGCTISAFINALGVTGVDVKPTDINSRTPEFHDAMRLATFQDLSGNNIGPFDAFSTIPLASEEGQKLEAAIKQSLRDGNPVVIGMNGGKRYKAKDPSFNGNIKDLPIEQLIATGKYPRHSLTAVGINADGDILVIDPWRRDPTDKGSPQRALVTTLKEAMKNHGRAPGLDIAHAVLKSQGAPRTAPNI